MEPGPGLRRSHRSSQQMVRRRSPSRRAERFPSMSFALAQISICVARQRRGWCSVTLNTKPGFVLVRPIAQRLKKSLIEKLGQRLPPIVSYRERFRPEVVHKRRQLRAEIIAASLLKLLQKIVCPIGVVNFKAVTKNCIRRTRVKGFHQTVANFFQIVIDADAIQMIDYKTFRANSRTLNLHPGSARNEKLQLSGTFIFRDRYAVSDIGDLAQRVG